MDETRFDGFFFIEYSGHVGWRLSMTMQDLTMDQANLMRVTEGAASLIVPAGSLTREAAEALATSLSPLGLARS